MFFTTDYSLTQQRFSMPERRYIALLRSALLISGWLGEVSISLCVAAEGLSKSK
jgi:hypothetical protein